MSESRFRGNSPNVGDPIIPNGKPDIFDDEIVIAGFSGRLPESSNIEEFKKQLYDGFDFITDDERRWHSGIYGTPTTGGKLKDLSKFDASFFGVHSKQADVMDPQMRILLELTYEAIVDAGINPLEMRGSKTAVHVGVTTVEAHSYWLTDPDLIDGYRALGSVRAMLPNRISYTFDFKGPSSAIQTACSSALTAFNRAVDDIRYGKCDAAIVAGTNLTMDPINSLQYSKLSMLASDGRCRPFDANGLGYVRSEAVVVMFLQKSRDAKRIYATVVNSKTNTDGHKPLISYPSRQMQAQLMRELYLEVGVDPAEVPFVEAHGTGTEAGDLEEANAITDVFCKNRKEPLLLGSVKSNMGHAEPVSGLCSIIKVLLAMETGVLAGNLHFKTPNPNIPALIDGRIKVVDRHTPWNGGFAGINSFGAGGSNVHVLLRSNKKQKVPLTHTKVPKIVAVSGRTEEAVKTFLDKVKDHEKDDEFISMVHDIHASKIKGHEYRGFQILGNESMMEVEEVSEQKRPLWYVFAGNGSQWSGMGQAILSIDSVRKSLERCANAVKSKGIDLIDIIRNGKNETPEKLVNSYVCLTSIQVALIDLLSLLGIQPDGMIGHSVGELACAYADGTLTAEEAVLVSYWRAQSVVESNLPKGSMAAIGLSWEETEKRCPADICLACHNSLHSVTVSGPSESVAKFVEQLKKEDIFARLFEQGVAFHSKYITPAGPKFRAALEKIVPLKKRSPKWISSSVPESQWDTSLAQFSSPAYFVNNLLSPVRFQEALTHVPEDAIVVEIAPHALFQAVLRRALPPTVTKIGLQNRDHNDNLSFLLASLGKLYISGGEPKLSKLYPPVTYPVGRGTPMINSMVEWDHSVQWSVPDFCKLSRHSGQNKVEVDLSNEKDAYIADHCINQQIIFPVSAYLNIVWKTFAGIRGKDFEKTPVVFENILFHRPIIMEKDSSAKLIINILEGTGAFEISENGSSIVTGKIRSPENMEMKESDLPAPVDQNEPELLRLNKADIYKDLRLRGHDYRGIFQNIESSDNRGLCGKLFVDTVDNWIPFLDSMIQFTILGQNNREALLPTHLKYAAINPVLHKQMLEKLQDEGMPVYNYQEIDVVKAGGVVLRGMKFSLCPNSPETQPDPKLEKYVFVPFENTQSLAKDEENAKWHALCVLLQVAQENIGRYKIKVIEVTGECKAETLLAPLALDIFRGEPLLSVDFKLVTSSPNIYSSFMEKHHVQAVFGNMLNSTVGQDLHLILTRNILKKEMKGALKNLEASLTPGGFILSEEPAKVDSSLLKSFKLQIVGQQTLPDKSYVLLRKDEEKAEHVVIQITEKNFAWLEKLKAALRTSEKEGHKILIFSQGENTGLAGFMTCLRLEPGGLNARYFFIQDKNAPKFSPSNAIYAGQVMKQLSANVLKDGKWGCYRHLRLPDTRDEPSFEVEHAYLDTLVKGDWNSVRWIESPLQYNRPNNSRQDLCHVYYAGINIRDISSVTSGKLNLPYDVASQDGLTKYGIGLEFAGRDSTGRRVMGMVPTGGIATTLLADPVFIWEVPETWSMAEAATIPVAYAMSYYALIIKGRLSRGKSLLIHDGSGKVGQASISIALHIGCSVLTTVNSEEKRDFLKGKFPQLKESNIINYQNANFEQRVLYETRGKGVDIVLNSLPEEHFMASTSCLAKNGYYLEIEKYNHSDDINLEDIFNSDYQTKREIVRLVSDGIKTGVVLPMPALVFSDQEVKEAFKLMISKNYVDKVLIKIREEESHKVTKPSIKTIAAIRRTYFSLEKSYVLVGGLGGFGLELANWMVTRGAKYIILTSRSGVKSGYQALCIRKLREMGATIQVFTGSVTTKDGAESLLKEAGNLAPVGGIFNLAAVLHEALIDNLNEDHFKAVTLPKVDGTKNLDSASRKYCPSLEYFVCFSSNASGRGNAGQTNYALANSTMERIMEERRALELPGLAIQWGPIGDVGIVAESRKGTVKVLNGKYPQRISSCLKTLDFLLQQPHPVLGSLVIAEVEDSDDSSNQLSVLDIVAKILEIKDVKKVDMSKSLPELGMDSMMGTEIKITFEKKLDLFLPLQVIRTLTFGKLVELSK